MYLGFCDALASPFAKTKFNAKTTLTNAELHQKIHSPHTFVHRTLSTKLFRRVFNFDEIPLSLRGSMRSLKTVADIAEQDIRASVNPNDRKRCATLICGAGVVIDENLNPVKHFFTKPMILFKAKSNIVINETFDARTTRGITAKAVVNSPFFIKCFIPFLRAEFRAHRVEGPTLTIMDSARPHITTDVLQAFAEKLQSHAAVLPGGCTCWLQWVDVYYAFHYKAAHTSLWEAEHSITRTAKEKRTWLHSMVARQNYF